MIELIKLLEDIQGKNPDGTSKSAVTVDEKSVDSSGMAKFGREYTFTTPVVTITHNGEFIMVDLTFPLQGAAELRTAWSYLERFGNKNNQNLDGAEINILEFMLVPLKYNGQYFCTLVNPVFWALQHSSFGNQVNSIRMLFEKEAVNFYEGSPADIRTMDRDIDNELFEEERAEEDARLKEREREEYLDRVNARRNSMNK